MEKWEKVTWRIWNAEGFGRILLIGGLLFYIPFLNLILLGYYGLWARRLIRQEGFALPEWAEGRAILEELGRVILPFLVWVGIPFFMAGLLVWSLSGLLNLLHMGLFALTLAWLPLTAVALLSPPALMASLMRLYKEDSLHESMDIPRILQSVLRHFRSCLFPLIQFYGILLLGWPLIGFAVLLATLPLTAHLVLVFRDASGDLKS